MKDREQEVLFVENISDAEILKFAIENGMIDEAYVQKKLEMQKREELLKKHPFEIWQGNDKRWRTYLPDESKTSGRRLIAKSSLEKLQDEIICFLENDIGVIKVSPNVTLNEIYPLWLNSRKLEVTSINTIKKNSQDWKRYYVNDEISKIPMKNLTAQQLKDWAHKKIDDNQLNKRDYYNMAIIIKQCYSYAKDIEAIPIDTWSKVKINTKKLLSNKKKENVTQVYFSDEKKKIVEYAFQRFSEKNNDIVALVIPLLFLTGLRAGEIVALKYSDVIDNRLYIQREETINYNVDDKGEFVYDGRKIVDHAKTAAGTRSVPLTKEAKDIIKLIKKASVKSGYYDNDYIFCPNSKRMAAVSVDTKLYRYCDALGIDKKSAHKIRKTYISELINSGEIDIDTICRIVGHVDMNTTFKSYCYSLDREDVITDKFESVIKCNQDKVS